MLFVGYGGRCGLAVRDVDGGVVKLNGFVFCQVDFVNGYVIDEGVVG